MGDRKQGAAKKSLCDWLESLPSLKDGDGDWLASFLHSLLDSSESFSDWPSLSAPCSKPPAEWLLLTARWRGGSHGNGREQRGGSPRSGSGLP